MVITGYSQMSHVPQEKVGPSVFSFVRLPRRMGGDPPRSHCRRVPGQRTLAALPLRGVSRLTSLGLPGANAGSRPGAPEPPSGAHVRRIAQTNLAPGDRIYIARSHDCQSTGA
ncbi:hypothetical protein RHS03_06307, partial [Rhizoctonia solani]